MYILDEPSIGLHPRDNTKLLKALCELRDTGNTVVVIEHDEETMKAADKIIDIGPGAGKDGGEIIAKGKLAEIKNVKKSLTAQYLTGKKEDYSSSVTTYSQWKMDKDYRSKRAQSQEYRC